MMRANGLAQRQADDLFDEPVPVLPSKVFTQAGLELGDQLFVDLADDGFDGGHR